MQAEDRIIFLEKRAKKFLRQTPSVWDSIDIGRIPDNGGVILITLLGERKEIPIHINYCKSLKKEIASQKVIQELFLQNESVVWLSDEHPKVLNREQVIKQVNQYLYVRYMEEADVMEQMALTVTIVKKLKPVYWGN
jgi:hypothetical protein